MLRFKITDFTAQQPIQNILIKLWRLVAQLQYDVKMEKKLRKSHEASVENGGPANQSYSENSHEIEYSVLPVDLALYDQVIFIFKRTLGVLFETDYYVAKKGTVESDSSNVTGGYLKLHVFFDRFCFDMVSLLGDYLNCLTFSDVEYIMRKVYQHSTHFTVVPIQG